MVTSGGQAVFAVVAKDAATKTLNGVGKSFGGLKRNGIRALKGIATASIAAATALIGFSIAAVKSAAEDERAAIRLNAALKARGFALDSITPKVDEQIQALQRLGFTDDDVKDGIEIGSRFIKDQEDLFRANAVAANIAAVTGKSLAAVQLIIGRAVNGSTRGLVQLGVEVEKGAKLKDILLAADKKYAGTAEELAKSTSGKFLTAQIRFNEAIESFGYDLLPFANEALGFLTEKALPAFENLMKDLGPLVGDLIDKYVRPLVTSFNDLAKTMGFDDGFGFLLGALDVALIPFKIALAAIKALIDGINEAFKLFNSLASSKTGALLAGNARTQYLSGGNLGAAAPMGDTSGYLQTNIQFSIGTQKQDELVSNSLQRMAPGRRGGY
jgi:hypothetical protein